MEGGIGLGGGKQNKQSSKANRAKAQVNFTANLFEDPPPHPSPHRIGETAAVTWFNPYLKGYIENSLPPKIDGE